MSLVPCSLVLTVSSGKNVVNPTTLPCNTKYVWIIECIFYQHAVTTTVWSTFTKQSDLLCILEHPSVPLYWNSLGGCSNILEHPSHLHIVCFHILEQPSNLHIGHSNILECPAENSITLPSYLFLFRKLMLSI